MSDTSDYNQTALAVCLLIFWGEHIISVQMTNLAYLIYSVIFCRSELDFQISRQVDAVMHHEGFQVVESLWYGVKSLVVDTPPP
ncbi:hypothetical protein FMK81_26225 [Klebsiella oxytoca]|nr:hypothetical protein [Klebsiella oxytoca]